MRETRRPGENPSERSRGTRRPGENPSERSRGTRRPGENPSERSRGTRETLRNRDNGGPVGGKQPGGRDERMFNRRLLIMCIIGGAIGTVAALLMIGALYTEISNVKLFGMVIAVIALGVLLGAATTAHLYRRYISSSLVIALIGTVIMFLAGALFEFIYELHFSIRLAPLSQQEQEICLTDYFFCIDDSGSMQGNDPDRIRDTALAELLESIDPTCQVGLVRYTGSIKNREYVYPALLDDDQKALLLDVINNHTEGGGTSYEEPLKAGLREYRQINEDGRTPVVILMTDGECSLDVQKWANAYNEQGVTICAIYLGESEQIPPVLEELCGETNGFVLNAENAGELVNTYGNLVAQTANTRYGVAYDPYYYRFLAGPRRGADRAYILAIIERILFLGMIGALLGAVLMVMLGELLGRQIITGGICGLIAGAIMEFGYLMGLGSLSRIGLLLYAIVLADCYKFASREDLGWTSKERRSGEENRKPGGSRHIEKEHGDTDNGKSEIRRR